VQTRLLRRWVRRHRLSARVLGEFRVEQLSRSPKARDLQRCTALTREGSVFVDVGASVGNYSLAACRKLGRSGMVLALEPNPLVFEELLASTWGARITPLNLAASDRSGWATLRVPVSPNGSAEGPLGSLETRASADQVAHHRVRTVRLDDLISGTQAVSVIKVDVEGHELSVLQGATETMSRDRPCLVVEIEDRHLVDVGVHDVVEWTVGQGYEAFAIGTKSLIPWAEFSVHQHQTRWLTRIGATTSIIPGAPYINNFLFIPID